MRTVKEKMFLIAGIIFLALSVISFVAFKSKSILIGGATVALLCVLFNFIFKVKWNALVRESFLKVQEEIKGFGNNLPLKFLGKLQILWLILLIATFIEPLALSFFPLMPTALFTIVNNVAFAFLLIGSFYQLLQGDFKGLSFITGAFAVYNILEVVHTFIFDEKVLSIKSMCLFLAFWSIHRIFSVFLCEKDPEEDKPVKVKKDKSKEKAVKDKKKKDKKNSEVTNANNAAVDEFIAKQEEAKAEEENKE